ncbi:MAG TPA: hypothetical protein PK781_07330 [Terrimesophilobacter sp.]|nr:hypothetical protein [Terrimesophilobacter sp.]
MIEWLVWLHVMLAILAGVFCIVMGLRKSPPNDYTLGATLLIELFLLAQLVVALLAPAVGNPATGDVLEFYAYLLTAIVMLPLAGFWALTDRSNWSNVVLGVANLAIAVMLIRMLSIWFA